MDHHPQRLGVPLDYRKCIGGKRARQINADRTDHHESVGHAAGSGIAMPPDASALFSGSPWYVVGDPSNTAYKFKNNGSFSVGRYVGNNFDWNSSVVLHYRFILKPDTKAFIYQQTGAEISGRTYGMEPVPRDGKIYNATYQITGNTFVVKCTVAGCGKARTTTFKSR